MVESDPPTRGDIPNDQFRRLLHEVADWIADYRENLDSGAVAETIKPGSIAAALPGAPPESGKSVRDVLREVEQVIIPGLVHWGHPRFLGYFGSTTTAPGILAEMIAAAVNVNAMTWKTSPSATELETLVLDWLRQWLGLPSSFRGVVYDTASVSTFHALTAAREAAFPGLRQTGFAAKRFPTLRVYASDQAHSSVERAVIALGLGEDNVQRVPSDEEFCLRAPALRRLIADDVSAGHRPLAVVATVGTTSTASVDPVPAIAEICRDHKMWLHIDAAYGGGLALLPETRWVAAGWAEADSLVINPHKMLFVPFDFSALYVRNIERLRHVFTLVPEYLKGDSVGADINYMDYGIQLGRRFRALKAFMVWRTFGRIGLAERIREHLRLASLFGQWVTSNPRFRLLAPVTMGVVCFGVQAPDEDEAGALTRELVHTVNQTGQTYLTLTRLNNRDAIRLGLGNILTTEQHLRSVWDLLQDRLSRIGARLETSTG